MFVFRPKFQNLKVVVVFNLCLIFHDYLKIITAKLVKNEANEIQIPNDLFSLICERAVIEGFGET